MRVISFFIVISCFFISACGSKPDDLTRANSAYQLYLKGQKAFNEQRFLAAKLYVDNAVKLSAEEGVVLIKRDFRPSFEGSGRAEEKVVHVYETREAYYPKQLLAKIDTAMEEARTETERVGKQQNPPKLVVTMSLIDSDQDGTLSAGEQGYIKVKTSNHGDSYAHMVSLKLSSKNKALEFETDQHVFDRIAPKKSQQFTFKVSLDKDFDANSLVINAAAEELDGFGSDLVATPFKAEPYYEPLLEVKPVKGNIAIPAGLEAQIVYRVTNRGKGTARNLQFSIDKSAQSKAVAKLVDMAPIKHLKFGEYVDIYVTVKAGSEMLVGQDLGLSLETDELNIGNRKLPLFAVVNEPATYRQNVTNGGSQRVKYMATDILQPAKSKSQNPHHYAVLIGNQSYKDSQINMAVYARDDVQAMKTVLIKSMGIPEENIIIVYDLTLGGFNALLGTSTSSGRLHERLLSHQQKYGVKPELTFFYSGHGAPASNNRWSSYLVTADAQISALNETAVSVETLYERLARLPTSKQSLYLEACFSGRSSAGTFFGNVSPITIKTQSLPKSANGIDVYSAAQQDQVANWLPAAELSAFTYSLTQGLSGKADANGDKALTSWELRSYVKSETRSVVSKMDGHTQRPDVTLHSNRVLTTYR